MLILIGCTHKNTIINLDLTELKSLEEILADKSSKKVIILSSAECENCLPLKRNIKNYVDSLNANGGNGSTGNTSIYSISSLDRRNKSINAILRQITYPTIMFFDGSGRFKGIVATGKFELFKNYLDSFENNKELWLTPSHNIFKDLKLSTEEKTDYINDILTLSFNKPSKDASTVIDRILKKDSVDYFYKNYLISKYYYDQGDTIQSTEFAKNAEKISFSNLDSALYNTYKVDLAKFKKNKANELTEFCFGIAGCEYITTRKELKDNILKINLTNYFEDIISIKQVVVDCSCYTIDMPQQKILPKKSAPLYLTITKNENEIFDQIIHITSNLGEHNFRILIK